MNGSEFEKLCQFVSRKAEKMSAIDDSPGEPWHVADEALTGDYHDISIDELVLSVQALFTEFSKAAAVAYLATGLHSHESDAVQAGIIALVCEAVLAVTQTVALQVVEEKAG